MNGLQKAAAQAIVNIFETGRAAGDYARVTLLPGDTGRLSYGRAQTTIASGNLYRLILAYSRTPGAARAAEFEPYLGALSRAEPALDEDAGFRRLLRRAGDDPAMRRAQDDFFDRVYWMPAERAAARIGVAFPLGLAVVYDSHIHGSWDRVRALTEESIGTVHEAGGEQSWIAAYVGVRRRWLSTRRAAILRATVYRMDAFSRLIEEGRWELDLPFQVRGVWITKEELSASMPAPPGEEGQV